MSSIFYLMSLCYFTVVQLSPVQESGYFGASQPFIKKVLDKPRVVDGAGEIVKISETKRKVDENDERTNTLLRDIYNTVKAMRDLQMDSTTAVHKPTEPPVSPVEKLSISKEDKERKLLSDVYKILKRDSDKNTQPTTTPALREPQQQRKPPQNVQQPKKDLVTFDDLVESLDSLTKALNKKPVAGLNDVEFKTDYNEANAKADSQPYETSKQHSTLETLPSWSGDIERKDTAVESKKGPVSFEEFKDVFLKAFPATPKDQRIIYTGRKDDKKGLTSLDSVTEEKKSVEDLYEELRRATVEESAKRDERSRKRESEKRELVELLNQIIGPEKLQYDGNRVSLVPAVDPMDEIFDEGKEKVDSQTALIESLSKLVHAMGGKAAEDSQESAVDEDLRKVLDSFSRSSDDSEEQTRP